MKQETINTLSRAHLKHAPGAMAVYCNDGFTLAEMIVERVSRQKYIDFLDKRIFKPLGLKNTGIGVGEIKGKPVALYYDPKTGKMHPPETLSVLGAGGLVVNCRGALPFCGCLFSGRQTPEESISRRDEKGAAFRVPGQTEESRIFVRAGLGHDRPSAV